jgi:PiT family inorganic phosphate transporter
MLITILFVAACFVAFTNGANANFKGVASLYGSGTTTLRTAALWGTATTFAGSITSLFLVGGLLAAFRGRGIVPDSLVASAEFITAVALGGALTSFLATRFGFPVSTTHALVGAILGAGLAANSNEVQFAALGKLFLLPLFVSPVIAAFAGVLLFAVLMWWRVLPERRTRVLDVLHFASTGARVSHAG